MKVAIENDLSRARVGELIGPQESVRLCRVQKDYRRDQRQRKNVDIKRAARRKSRVAGGSRTEKRPPVAPARHGELLAPAGSADDAGSRLPALIHGGLIECPPGAALTG